MKKLHRPTYRLTIICVTVAADAFFALRMRQIVFAAGALPRTPLEEIAARGGAPIGAGGVMTPHFSRQRGTGDIIWE